MVQARQKKQAVVRTSPAAVPTTAAAASGASTVATSAGHSAAAQSYFRGAVAEYQAAVARPGDDVPPPPPPPAAEARPAAAPPPPPPPPLPPAADDEDDGGVVLDGRAQVDAAIAAPPPPPLKFETAGIQMTGSGQPIVIQTKGDMAVVSAAHTDLKATVNVIGGTSEQARDYELGFVQTVLRVERKFKFTTKTRCENVRLQTVPDNTRDAHAGVAEPWYEHHDNADTGKSFVVKMDDGPEARVPWKEVLPQANINRQLQSSTGKDQFCAWVIARPLKGGEVIHIAWVEWEVDWGADYDSKDMSGKPTTGKLSTVGSGLDKGPHTPALTGNPANKTGVGRWVME